MNNTTFTLICGVLVLQMQLGFALLEAGMVEARIAVSVLYKNVLDLCVGTVFYFAFGYWVQTGYHPLADGFADLREGPFALVHPYAHFFYHAAFAATAATICSGAVAGRMKLPSYLVLSTIITAVFYPLAARFLWGTLSPVFHDLAGSVVVHTVGGSAALAACLVLGTRKQLLATLRTPGKSAAEKLRRRKSDAAGPSKSEVSPPPVFTSSEMMPKAHSIPLATAGMFFLYLGWFGFNMGSVTADIATPAGLALISQVAVTTALAAAGGGAAAWLFGIFFSTPSLTSTLNGILGGAVIITASADIAHPGTALVLGFFAAFVVVGFSAWQVRRDILEEHFDDPVGAVGVHLLCGLLGGLGVLLSDHQHWQWQLGITFAPAAIIFTSTFIVMKLLRRRPSLLLVSPHDAERGLDISLYQEQAYKIFSHKPTLSSIALTIEELLGEVDKRQAVFTFTNGALFHDDPFHNGERIVFSGAITTWLTKVRNIAEMFGAEYGHLKCSPSATDFQKNIINRILAFGGYPNNEGRDSKESAYSAGLTGVIDELIKLRDVVSHEAQIEADSHEALETVQQMKSELDESLKTGEKWVAGISEKMTENNARLETIEATMSNQTGDPGSKWGTQLRSLEKRLESSDQTVAALRTELTKALLEMEKIARHNKVP